MSSNLNSLKITVQEESEEGNYYLKPQYPEKTNVNILVYFFCSLLFRDIFLSL